MKIEVRKKIGKVVSMLLITILCFNSIESSVQAYEMSSDDINSSEDSFEDKIKVEHTNGDVEILEYTGTDYSQRHFENEPYLKEEDKFVNDYGYSGSQYIYSGGTWVYESEVQTNKPLTITVIVEGRDYILTRDKSLDVVVNIDERDDNPFEGEEAFVGEEWSITYVGIVEVTDYRQVEVGDFIGEYEGIKIEHDEAIASYGQPPNSPMVADPVNSVTGNFYTTEVDWSISSLSGSMQVERAYNSQDHTIGLFGEGWKLGFDSFISYDEQTLNASLIYPDGHVIKFTYNSADGMYDSPEMVYDILSVDDTGLFSLRLKDNTVYKYNQNNRLAEIVDQNSNVISIQYDEGDSISSVRTDNGERADFTIVNGLIDSISTSDGKTISYQYDANSRLTDVISVDGTINYTYDDNGITSISDKESQIFITNIYDEFGRIEEQTDGEGAKTYFDYSESTLTNTITRGGDNAATKYTYSLSGYIEKVEYPDGTYEQYGYDEYGNKNVVRNRLGDITNYAYDERGNMTHILSPAPFYYETVMEYDNDDNIKKITYPDGGEQRFLYDAKGNVEYAIVKIDDNREAITHFTYDTHGRVISMVDPEGKETVYEYQDAIIGPVKVTDPEGYITEYTYDTSNRVKTYTTDKGTTSLSYNVSGDVATITDTQGYITKFTYDSLGNVIKAISPENYDVQVDDGLGTVNVYDKMDRLVKQTNPIGDIFAIDYDEFGNIEKEYNAEFYDEVSKSGPGTTYEYNTDDRLIKIINAKNQITRIKYDALGQVIKRIDAKYYDTYTDDGDGISYSYDSNNRLSFVYDQDGNVLKHFIYDSMGRVLKEIDGLGYLSDSTDNNRYGTLYKYNLAG